MSAKEQLEAEEAEDEYEETEDRFEEGDEDFVPEDLTPKPEGFKPATVKEITLMDVMNKLIKVETDVLELGQSLDVVYESFKALGANTQENNKKYADELNVIRYAIVQGLANMGKNLPAPPTQNVDPKPKPQTDAPRNSYYDSLDNLPWRESKYPGSWYIFGVNQDVPPKLTEGTEQLQEDIRQNDWKPILINGFNYSLSKPDKDNIRRFLNKNTPKKR